MQIFELNQLPIYQQEILKPIIKKQKSREKIKSRTFLTFFSIFWGFNCLIILVGFMFGIIDIFSNGFEFELILPMFMLLIMFLFFSFTEKAILYALKININNTNQDDFYIIYGHIDNKEHVINYTNRKRLNSFKKSYKYIIENQTFYVRENLFKNFKYEKVTVKEYRYLLLRKFDNCIRADLTEYFRKV